MYAETELVFPSLQELGLSFTLEADYPHHHHLQLQLQEEEFLHHLCDQSNISISSNCDNSFVDGQYYYHNTQVHLPIDTSPVSDLARTPSISEYGLGAEGDLFKVPEHIMELGEPLRKIDPLTASVSLISCGEDVTNTETIRVEDMEAIENDLLSEVFFDCKKDFLEKTIIEETFPELADIKFPTLDMEDDQVKQMDELAVADSPMQKSVSYECLSSNELTNEGPNKLSFLDFQAVDLGAAFGLRRAYSEGDIKTLGNGNAAVAKTNVLHPTYEHLRTVDDVRMEERRQKLSRYRRKKTKRNFGRKIKYACRKALADNQPRVRGRFARTEEHDVAKTSKL